MLDRGLPHLVVKLPNDRVSQNEAKAEDIDESREEKILGCAYATQHHPRPGYAGTIEFSIYLSPAATGRGTGKNLLTTLIDDLKAVSRRLRRPNRIAEAVASTAISEENDARSFSVREGFRQVRWLYKVGWKMGRWVDTVTF